MPTPLLSVIVLTKDEEANLPRFLASFDGVRGGTWPYPTRPGA